MCSNPNQDDRTEKQVSKILKNLPHTLTQALEGELDEIIS